MWNSPSDSLFDLTYIDADALNSQRSSLAGSTAQPSHSTFGGLPTVGSVHISCNDTDDNADCTSSMIFIHRAEINSTTHAYELLFSSISSSANAIRAYIYLSSAPL